MAIESRDVDRRTSIPQLFERPVRLHSNVGRAIDHDGEMQAAHSAGEVERLRRDPQGCRIRGAQSDVRVSDGIELRRPGRNGGPIADQFDIADDVAERKVLRDDEIGEDAGLAVRHPAAPPPGIFETDNTRNWNVRRLDDSPRAGVDGSVVRAGPEIVMAGDSKTSAGVLPDGRWLRG